MSEATESFIPSSPINTDGDRILVRGEPEGIELLVQQARATARAQAQERVICHLEQVDGLLELLSEDQLDQLIEVVLHCANHQTLEYARSLVQSMPKAIGRIPTYQFFPDARDPGPLILKRGSGPCPQDPLVSEAATLQDQASGS